MAEQLGMKLPPGRGLLSQGTTEDAASSASSSSQSETPEPGNFGRDDKAPFIRSRPSVRVWASRLRATARRTPP
ncbi:neuronal PAS domain protein 3 (predicted), isoform CRA_a [Rattus norvegicus]|uniref:Neuronal PAS domain protein 3 (Predicted), isoform CRA_a n=1 Tax=Rattus norvegicus TaxID=10116 RepID=A6HBJ6_RAT|nr:neuronal PAS domain protein 3 (predicted), isoform CRA_a [Rattus norvegicus]